MRGKLFASLRVRLLLLMMLAVLPPFVLILYNGFEQRRAATREAEQQAHRLARLVTSSHIRLVETSRQLLTVLSHLPAVRAVDPERCNPLLAELLQQYPLYANLGVTTAEGLIMCSGLPIASPIPAGDRLWFQRAVQTKRFVVGDYQVGRITGKRTVNFSVPVLSPLGKVEAVVFAALDLDWLTRVAVTARLPAGAVLTAVDRSGTIIARYPDPEKWVGTPAADSPLVRGMLAHRGEGTMEAVGLDGVSRLYAFMPMSPTGSDPTAFVSVGIPAELAYAEADRMLRRSLIFLVGAAVLALVGVWVAEEWLFLRHVRTLAAATTRLRQGDLSARAGVPYDKGELGQLAAAFDEMTAALQQRAAERERAADALRGLNADLDRRVQERTQALEQSVAQIRDLYNKAPCGYHSLGADGVYRQVNDTALQWLGYTREEVEGKMRFEQFLTASSRLRFAEIFPKFKERGVVRDVEFELVRKDGSILPVVINSTAVKDERGQFVMSRSTIFDISERKRIEEELRLFFDVSLDLLCIASLDGYFLKLNAAWTRTLGWSDEELKAQPFLAFVHPDDADATVEAATRLAGGTEVVGFDNRYRCKDGSYRWISWNARAVRERGIIIAAARDITDRKVAEQELRRARDLLDSIVENIPNMVFMKDAKELRFVLFNRAGEELLGRQREEMLGKNDYDFFPKEEADFFTAKDREVLANGKLLEIPAEPIQTKERGTRILHTTKVPMFDERGQPLYLLGISADITDRQRAEEELKQTARELARSNQELEVFAYVASHDLQEPLRAVAGFVQLLQQQYQGKLDARADEYIQFVVSGATRMQALIIGLLEYSRVETHGKPFVPTDCEQVFTEVCANLRVAINESAAVVTHDPLPTVMADPPQLAQVFQNLIANGIKFHGASAPRVHCGVVQFGDEWKFSVRDNGIGFEPKYADKIFVLFQRLHTQREYPGTGLGLAICRRIVERHGGRIWVESTPGAGTTFYFTLPARSELS